MHWRQRADISCKYKTKHRTWEKAFFFLLELIDTNCDVIEQLLLPRNPLYLPYRCLIYRNTFAGSEGEGKLSYHDTMKCISRLHDKDYQVAEYLYMVGNNIIPGGSAIILNSNYNEFYTNWKPVKKGIFVILNGKDYENFWSQTWRVLCFFVVEN